MTHFSRIGFAVALLAAVHAAPANGQNLNISIENNQSTGGFYLTPLWFGIHNGSFDYFDGNDTQAPSASLIDLAEGGVLTGLQADFTAAQPGGTQGVFGNPAGFGGAPVIDPGEIAMTSVSVNNPATNQFFSYGSMVIPSNDAFIGNDDGMAHQLFDNNGDFVGPLTIQIFGSDVYDAGSEVNDGLGAAFSANGGVSTDEFLNVRFHPGLDNFIGTFTAAGTEITSGLDGAELLATITITSSAIPEPGTFTVLALASGSVLLRRRRS